MAGKKETLVEVAESKKLPTLERKLLAILVAHVGEDPSNSVVDEIIPYIKCMDKVLKTKNIELSGLTRKAATETARGW